MDMIDDIYILQSTVIQIKSQNCIVYIRKG